MMTNEQFAPADRIRFCDEIDAIPRFRKFLKKLNHLLAVRNANKENKLAIAAFNRGDDDAYLTHRYIADVLWAEVYGVKMWKENSK